MAIPSTFPNILAPDSDKNSKEFGLKFLVSAFERWKQGSFTNESALARKQRYDYNRAYAAGKQNMQEFKDILDLDGEQSVINLAFDPLPIAIPFINRKKDGWLQRIEKIQCNAIDPFTQTKKEKAKADALFKLKNKEQIQELQQQAGVQLEEFSEDDPQDENELNVQFGFTYKEREEVIMEQGIDLVFYENDWSDVIKDRMLTDLINCGVTMIWPYIDPTGRIRTPFVAPEDIITSYCVYDDFRDAQYLGRVKEASISDVRLKYPGKVSEEELWKLSQRKEGKYSWTCDWNYEYENALARPYDSFRVTLVEVSMKTLYNLKYEVWEDKYGTEKLIKVDVNTKEIEGHRYIKSKPYEVEYFGCYIAETDHLLEWGLAKNMVKPENNLTEIRLPAICYMYSNNKMTNTPMIETMIPSIKLMQLVALQQQKIIASAAPDGFLVDISTMSDITLGPSLKDLNPAQQIKIYKQTGFQYYKGSGDDGETRRNPPIQPSNVPFSGKLEQLMGVWNAEYDKLLRLTGSNDLAEGVVTNQAVGKQVVQDARQISESASNYIYSAYLNMMKRTAKLVQMRLWDILVYGKKDGITYYDGYRQALGTDRVEYIRVEATDDFERCQFDVKIEAVLDDNEANLLEQNIQGALVNQSIELQDAIDVRLLAKSNIKYASYMLASRYKKRRKELLEEKQADIQANNQAALISAQAASKGAMDLETLKSQLATKARNEELESLKQAELLKFVSIAKVETLKSIMNKEGGNISQVPVWVTDGIPLVNAVQQGLMQENLLELQTQAEQEQVMMQQDQQQDQQQPMDQDGQMPEGEMAMEEQGSMDDPLGLR